VIWQLDENLEASSGRLVVDRDLYASTWMLRTPSWSAASLTGRRTTEDDLRGAHPKQKSRADGRSGDRGELSRLNRRRGRRSVLIGPWDRSQQVAGELGDGVDQ
jgi:hypothetical protein